jgi:hypothetical protein
VDGYTCGSTITFDTAGDSITLVAIQTGASTYTWNLINNNGATISAAFDGCDFWRFAANDNEPVEYRRVG